MTRKLNSPGMASLETPGSVSNIKGSNVGIGWFIGIGEWGECGVVIECLSWPDAKKKIGDFLNGYYLAKALKAFFDNGGYKAYVVRTAHYSSGVLQAVKASFTAKGYNSGTEDRTKVNTLTFEASGHGTKGNKVNVTNLKVETALAAALTAGAKTYMSVDDITGFEVGDVVDIQGAVHYARVIITKIVEESEDNLLYFKSITLASEIEIDATVKTASTHIVRTTATEDLVTNAVSLNLASVTGIKVGSVLTIVDTQAGAPNSVTVKVTDISNTRVFFASVGTITTIATANSEVVSQEFDVKVYYNDDQVGTTQKYLSMASENEVDYIENKFSSEYCEVSALGSTENDIGDLPECFEDEYFTGGDDGLTGLTDADFYGDQSYKNGVYAFDTLPNMFAQFGSPDRRGATVQNAIIAYCETRGLWFEADVDFGKTPEEAKEYVMQTALLNTSYGEISYPNVKWRNPNTNVLEVIPQCGATMGLNARIWSTVGKGPWNAAAGVEDGLYKGIEGFENTYTEDETYRDLLYEARINALYRYPEYGNLKYGIRTLEVSGDFPQMPERLTFLYCRHSIINGTPWIVFKNIDSSSLGRLKKTVTKFLRGIWLNGGLKGLTEEEAFEIDVSEESVNTPERQEAGEIWCSVGLATKKAGEFAYFEFHKKVS